MALTSAGDVFAWGSARYGKLGIGDFSALPADPEDENSKYSDVPVLLPRHGTVVALESNFMIVNGTAPDGSEGLSADLQSLLESGELTDVDFEMPSGKVFKAHSQILAARSGTTHLATHSASTVPSPSHELRALHSICQMHFSFSFTLLVCRIFQEFTQQPLSRDPQFCRR